MKWVCDGNVVVVVVVVVVVSHIQRIGCQPEKLLYTVANPARGLLNREKRTKEKVWQHTPTPPTPHTARSEKIIQYTGPLEIIYY